MATHQLYATATSQPPTSEASEQSARHPQRNGTMSATPYRHGGSDEIGGRHHPTSVSATAEPSTPTPPPPSSNSTRRRRSPSSPTTALSLLSETVDESTGSRELSYSSPTHSISTSNDDSARHLKDDTSSTIDDERGATLREMFCNHVFGKSKVLVFGQLLSLFLVSRCNFDWARLFAVFCR
jgi:hypothetical protein